MSHPFSILWWASRESNTAPTDYESAALTKHELEALKGTHFIPNRHYAARFIYDLPRKFEQVASE